MANAKYYLMVKTVYGDDWSPVKRFEQKEEAEKEARKVANDRVRTLVLNTTQMRSFGWTKDRAEDEIYRIEVNKEFFNSLPILTDGI